MMSVLRTFSCRWGALYLSIAIFLAPAMVVQAQIECSVALNRADRLQVAQCTQCGESDVRGTESPVSLNGSFRLPDFASDATVFQSGWRLTYLDGSHKITGVLAAVQNIRRRGRELLWDSVGILRDQNFDDGYKFCNFVSVVAWDRAKVRMAVDHSQREGLGVFDGDGTVSSKKGQGSALTYMRLFRDHPFRPSTLPQPPAVVLPRGFEFVFTSSDFGCFDPSGDVIVSTHCRDDNDLLQMAVHKDHAEGFLPRGGPDNANGPNRVDTTVVGWTTFGIIKDNDARRDYRFKSAASTLGGTDVRAIEPPFAVEPRDDIGGFSSGCIGTGQSGVVTSEVVIENVPFEAAVPVLAGWDIGYGCRDDDVKDIGVWIEDFSYERIPFLANKSGTLRYRISRVLRDASQSEQHAFDHSIDILGIGPVVTQLGPGGGVVQPVQ